MGTLRQTSQNVFTDNMLAYSRTKQPVPGLESDDYIDIAEQAADSLFSEACQFCEENGFSYIAISHADFMQGYEKGDPDLSFRDWLDQYCASKGMDSRADMCIIGPRVKAGDSGNRKTRNKNAESNCDYLGIMFVALKKRKSPKNIRSLNNLEKAMAAIENDKRTVETTVNGAPRKAVKNYFNSPNKRRFRAHKSIWNVTVPEGKVFEGFPSAAEVKIEHESLMNIDKLTRSFMDLGRAMNRAVFQMAQASGVQSDSSANDNFYKHAIRTQRRIEAVDKIAALLYDRVAEDAGLNRFLPEASRKPAQTYDEIFTLARAKLQESCCPSSMASGLMKGISIVMSGFGQRSKTPPPASPFPVMPHPPAPRLIRDN